MADYYPVVRHAVDRLTPDDRQGRAAVYARAREVALESLRAANPPRSPADIQAELADLAAVCRRIESEMGGPAPRQPQMLQAPQTQMTATKPRMVRTAMGVAALAMLIAGGFAGYRFWPRAKAAPPAAQRAVEPEATPASSSYAFARQPVYYRTTHPVGTIIVSKAQHFVYVVQPNVTAMRYGIGVGPECSGSAGLFRVSRKDDHPGWGDPSAARDVSAPPDNRAATENNPFGARALYFDEALSLHGTNQPGTVGSAAPFGCFPLANENIVELYDRVPLQERVVVID
jgi:lipoprotein-anchoring transpeptidase ErfK/SrfK